MTGVRSAVFCRTAVISPCGRYRYTLTREFAEGSGEVAFVMLNPSTADANVDDPTIRRCMGYAQDWGYRFLTVLNLYALRSTDPKGLWRVEDPVGPDNDAWLKTYIGHGFPLVAAWGANAHPDRVAVFVDWLRDAGRVAYCLGATKAGAPKHPLYLPATAERVRWPVIATAGILERGHAR